MVGAQDNQGAIVMRTRTDIGGDLPASAERREKTRALKQAMVQEILAARTRLV